MVRRVQSEVKEDTALSASVALANAVVLPSFQLGKSSRKASSGKAASDPPRQDSQASSSSSSKGRGKAAQKGDSSDSGKSRGQKRDPPPAQVGKGRGNGGGNRPGPRSPKRARKGFRS